MLYGTYLAFDFGLSRTGVATGNSVTRSAEPRGILFAQTNAERWAAIEALVEHWEPVAFVVGVPRHPDGLSACVILEQYFAENASSETEA